MPAMLLVPAAIFAALLVATGWAKVLRPADTAAAVRQLGWPVPTSLVRALAFGEMSIGVWVMVTMSPWALATQALLYGMFGVWTMWALRSDTPLATCGCLGRDDTPPSAGHVAVNLLGVSVSAAAIGTGAAWVSAGALGDVAVTLVIVVGTWMAWSVLGDGARIRALVKS